MDRLTIPDEKIDGGWRRAVVDARAVKENAMTLYWMLKKYEDISLTPEQIVKLKKENERLKGDMERIAEQLKTVDCIIDNAAGYRDIII